MSDLISRDVEHLIENAIFTYVRGVPFTDDVNAKYTSCTIEEAKLITQHVIYSLYDGIAPGEAVKVTRCKDCVHCAENTRKNSDAIKCKKWLKFVSPYGFCQDGVDKRG